MDKLGDKGINIKFDPSGRYKKDESVFELEIDFSAFSEDNVDDPFVYVKCITIFKFENVSSLKEIPPFFYKNSIAIVFPYVRAYVSLMTNQANVKPFVLPTLNLSSLEVPLKENSVEV